MDKVIEQYWLNKLSKTTQRIDFSFTKKTEDVVEYSDFNLAMGEDLARLLKKLAKGNEAGMLTLMIGIFHVVIGNYIDENEIISATCSPDKLPILIRTQFNNNLSVKDYLNSTKKEVITSFRNGISEIDSIIDKVNITKLRKDKVNVALVNNWYDDSIDFFCNLDLVIAFSSKGDAFELNVRYNRNLFEEVAIQSFIHNYQASTLEALSNLEKNLGMLKLISSKEEQELIYDNNKTEKKFDQEKLVHELFVENVNRYSTKPAIVSSAGKISYQELHNNTNKIAQLLVREPRNVNNYIGVFLDRSIYMIEALLGILKCGGVYIPLEPYLPEERLVEMLDDKKIECLITDANNINRIVSISDRFQNLKKIICIDKKVDIFKLSAATVFDRTAIEQQSLEDVKTNTTSNDLAYIIYTSGSSGKPKGVEIIHKSVINLIEWVNDTFQVNSTDQLLFTTSVSFDLSVYDIFGILAAGGTIRLLDNNEVKEPNKIIKILEEENITFWDSAPAYMQSIINCIEDNRTINSNLRLAFLSGDWIPVSMPTKLKEIFPFVNVISLGGATEATIWSNFYPIHEVSNDWKSIPYGVPIQNCKYYILDDNMLPCPKGVPGNLYIGGICLANGYSNDPILTSKKFVANPFCDNEKVYNTGDRARWMFNGNIEFLGRNDTQVKLRGYRIELGEIEVKISEDFDLTDIVAMMVTDSNQVAHICVFLVAEYEINVSDIKSRLAEKLPEYMVPKYILPVSKMPVTNNGKLDRAKLLVLWEQYLQKRTVDYIPPGNEVEEKLVSIVQALLNNSNVGVLDNFFEIGGTSLLLVKLNNLINETFNINLTVVDQFRYPTIRQLSNFIIEGNSDSPFTEEQDHINEESSLMLNSSLEAFGALD